MFHVGQEVVCVDDAFFAYEMKGIPHHPAKGQVYTIRGFHPDNKGVGCVLEALVNPPIEFEDGVEEPHWHIERFRPINETDISIFTAMLNPITKKENA